MRRAAVPLAVALGVLTMLAGLGSGTAAAGTKELVEGTVFDSTCAVAGECPSTCPPPCGGPIPIPGGARSDFVCAEPQIVCPLAQSSGAGVSPDFCLQGLPCGVSYPVYSGQGGVVTVRRRGSTVPTAMATLPVSEGHFKIRLAPGKYVFRPYLPEPQCWVGPPASVEVTPGLRSPVPATIVVKDGCALQPNEAR